MSNNIIWCGVRVLFGLRRGTALLFVIWGILIIIGWYGSLKVVYGLYGPDPDSSHSLMLWYGVNAYGLEWIKEWRFTQDNWLFSLVPIHFFIFWMAKPDPSFVLLIGWMIFIASAAVAGFIAKSVDAPRSAMIVPVLLVFIGLYGHHSGLVSHSTTHNITNLFGLISVLILIQWMKNHSVIWLVSLSLLQIAGGLSDPWLIPAYTLPIALVSMVLFFVFYGTASWNGYLFLVMAASIVIIKTQCFDALGFLPKMDYHIGGWEVVDSNAIFLIKDLGGLFNVVPGNKSNGFLAAALSLCVFLALLTRTASLLDWRTILSSPSRIALFACGAISVGGVLAAVLISALPADDISARFLLNILYLGLIILSVLIELSWRQASRLLKLSVGLAAALFMVSGFVSNIKYIKAHGFEFNNSELSQLIRFLSKNNLNYGYGPYWGSMSNAVTAVTKSDIIIRPATFDRVNGQLIMQARVEASKLWYRREDLPAGQTEYFVMIRSDGEECPDTRLCMDGVIAQFGQPIRTLSFKDAVILVWNHPLIG